VRQTALHIRQAVVYDDSHGFPTGLGQIIIKNEDEAWRTYRTLSNFLQPTVPSRRANKAFRSSINQRMGRTELSCNSGPYQRSYKAHRWSYKKPSSHDTNRLRVRAVNSASISGQHHRAPITNLARVSIHRPYILSVIVLIPS
jgi:hypothetical protein